MFRLVSCSLVVALQYFLLFVHGEGQQARKNSDGRGVRGGGGRGGTCTPNISKIIKNY